MGGAEGAAAPPGASQVDPSYGSSGSWLARGTVPPIASASYPPQGATAGAAGAAGSGGSGGAEADKGGAPLEGAPAKALDDSDTEEDEDAVPGTPPDGESYPDEGDDEGGPNKRPCRGW